MRIFHIKYCLIICAAGLVISGCTGLVNDDAANANIIEWQKGESMAVADDQHLSEQEREAYRKDAEKLAVRYINELDSTQAEIPSEIVDLFYNGLIHIENADHPKAQAVTDTLEIHARAPAKPHEIIVYAEATAPWLEAWRNGNAQTGNVKVDNLMDRFNFSIVEFNDYQPRSLVELRADRVINGYAVGRLFEKVDKVITAGPDGVLDGNDIRVLYFENYLRFTFDYGFGDCPAGCINRHKWHFRVYKDGSVEFEGEEGALLKTSS